MEITGNIAATNAAIMGAVSGPPNITAVLSAVCEITGELSTGSAIVCELSGAQYINGLVTIPAAIMPPAYPGPYYATPSTSTQTFSTNELAMTQDFIVEPIPQCYGLITWNGAVLTVS